MDTNKWFHQYCTNLYRVGNYAFIEKEDARKYIEAQSKWKLTLPSHEFAHILLAAAQGNLQFSESKFINAVYNMSYIEYNNSKYNSLSDAYYNDDPTLAEKDIEQIEYFVKQFYKTKEDIEDALDSTDVHISYNANPATTSRQTYIVYITGTKSDVEKVFNAIDNEDGWVGGWESLELINDEIDIDNLKDPIDLDIDYLGEYFQLEKASWWS